MQGTFDEYSVEWVVKPGDPASKSLNKLRRLGFRFIVLPRSFYLSGNMVQYKDTPDDVVVRTRLLDCLKNIQII